MESRIIETVYQYPWTKNGAHKEMQKSGPSGKRKYVCRDCKRTTAHRHEMAAQPCEPEPSEDEATVPEVQ